MSEEGEQCSLLSCCLQTTSTDSVAEMGPDGTTRANSLVAPSVAMPAETSLGSGSGVGSFALSSAAGSRQSSTLSLGSGTRRPRSYREPAPDKLKYYAKDGEMQAILSTAKHYYRCWLLTKHAFPSLSVQADVAAKVYTDSGGDPGNTESRAGASVGPPPFHVLIGILVKEPKMRLVRAF